MSFLHSFQRVRFSLLMSVLFALVAVNASGEKSLPRGHDSIYLTNSVMADPETAQTVADASAPVKGKVVAWGHSWDRRCIIPKPNIDFIAVSAGADHSMGLKSDGTIVAWGNNFSDKCEVPEPNSNFIAVEAGPDNSLGLKRDGSVVIWGSWSNGMAQVPEPNTDFIALATGGDHFLGLKRNGSIVGWGRFSEGQLEEPEPNTNFIALAAGYRHSLGLKSDGSIVAWGSNTLGQCTIPAPNTQFIAIAARSNYSMALRSDGSIAIWGHDGYDQMTVPEPNTDFTAISAGETHCLGLKSDGSIVAWGSNEYNQISMPFPNGHFSAISAGGSHSLALELPGLVEVHIEPEEAVEAGARWRIAGIDSPWYASGTSVSIAAGEYQIEAYDDVAGWHEPSSQTVTVAPEQTTSTQLVYTAGLTRNLTLSAPHGYVIQRYSEASYNTHVKENFRDGTTLTLNAQARRGYRFSNWSGDVPTGNESSPSITIEMDSDKTILANYIQMCTVAMTWDTMRDSGERVSISRPYEYFSMVSAGYDYSLGLKTDGTVVAWGLWDYSAVPLLPKPNRDFIEVAAGRGHSLALKTDGSIFAWGESDYSPLAVPEPNRDFISVAAGKEHCLGLKADGSIVAWGSDEYNQCMIPGVNAEFVAISAGENHSLALKADGTVVVWGVYLKWKAWLPEPNNDFVAISAGGDFSLGLKADGSVMAWGYGDTGECNVPEPNTGFIDIAAGREHALGVKSDGSIRAWGDPDDIHEVEAPDENEGFVRVSAGRRHNIGLKPTGAIEVTLHPEGAINAGARWRVADTVETWHESGTSVPLLYGDYTIEFFDDFPGWHGPVRQDVTVVANETVHTSTIYTPGVTWTLNIDEGMGRVSRFEQKVNYRDGTTETLNPQVRQGYRFLKWEGDVPVGEERNNPLVVKMDANKSLTAEFIQINAGVQEWKWNSSLHSNPLEPNESFIAISAGVYHRLGLKSDGSILAWGSSDDSLLNIPEPNTDFIAVAAGAHFSLGLRSNGSVEAWGSNLSGQCEIPEPNSDFVDISTGSSHGLGLKSDGSIVAWGYDKYDQCAVPEPNSDFIAISAGPDHSLGLKSDGSIVAWGKNDQGQCHEPALNIGFSAIAAGRYHNLALKVDGSIEAWGGEASAPIAVPEPNSDFISIAAGQDFSLGLKSNGFIAAWGSDEDGQCQVPESNMGYVALSAGLKYGLALKEYCTLEVFLAPPQSVETGAKWRIADVDALWREAGTSVSLLCDKYTIEYFDDLPGWYGPEPQAVTLQIDKSVQNNVVYAPGLTWQLSVDTPHGYAVHEKTYYRDGAIAHLSAMPFQGYRFIGWTGDFPEGMETSRSLTLEMSADRSLVAQFAQIEAGAVAWGWNNSGQSAIPEPNADFVALSAGMTHVLGLKSNGSVVAWGSNSSGESEVPEPNANFVAIAAGSDHSLGLKSDGSVVAWGLNEEGQCSVPSPNTDFVAIAAGDTHCLALKSNGSIVAWGSNRFDLSTVPEPNSQFVAISAGAYQNIGLKSDGSIIAWGWSSGPRSFVSDPFYIAISAGRGHLGALKADGSIEMLIGASYGQDVIPEPNKDFIAISSGDYHLLGLKTDGSLAAWGLNTSSQCVLPESDNGYVSISAGAYHSLALNKILGKLHVTIEPQEAVEAGAQWRIAGRDARWRESATTVSLPASSVMLEFSDGVSGWQAPDARAVTLMANETITTLVVFTASPTWTLSLEANNGYIAHGKKIYHDATTATIWAMPLQGYRFSRWTGDVPKDSTTLNPLSLPMNADKSLVAEFVEWEGAGVLAWGRFNSSGQCTVPAMNMGFIAVSAGDSHSLGLKSNGIIVAWGSNTNGQCNVPEPNIDFVAIAAGDDHSLGLKRDGSIVAWGKNNYGQASVPDMNTDFIAISAGEYHNLALKMDGSIVAWGVNGNGRCNVPEPNNDFVAISAGAYHSLGLKRDGSIIAWGTNFDGQCVLPYPNTNFVSISAGDTYNLALKSDGSVAGWGENNYGQATVSHPNENYIAVAAGRTSSIGLKRDGSIVSWGKIYSASDSVPTPNTGYLVIARQQHHCLALSGLSGDLNVSLEPQEALEAGGRWRIADGVDSWRESGTTVTLLRGDYTIEFQEDISGWHAPNPRFVRIVEDKAHQVFSAYTPGLTWTMSLKAPNGSATIQPSRTYYRDGMEVTLTATPDENYHFDRWSGTVNSPFNPTHFTIKSTVTMTAHFELDTYALTIFSENGNVSADPEQALYTHGDSVTLTVAPDDGYHFWEWQGDVPVAIKMNNPLILKMETDTNIKAIINRNAKKPFQLLLH